jgi:hypothetical protein
VGATGATGPQGATGPTGVISSGESIGAANSPGVANTWIFNGSAAVAVTITSTSQHVLVQSNATVYGNGGTLEVGLTYNGNTPQNYIFTYLPTGNYNYTDAGISQIFTGLSPGTYYFGPSYYAYASGAYEEDIMTTVLVF